MSVRVFDFGVCELEVDRFFNATQDVIFWNSFFDIEVTIEQFWLMC